MAQVHATAAFVVLAGTAAFLLFALWCARIDRGQAALGRARIALVGLIGVEAALGVVLYVSSNRPAENLHLLYGAVAVGALPAAAGFAAEAPPRAKATTFAVATLLMLAMIWRLWATG